MRRSSPAAFAAVLLLTVNPLSAQLPQQDWTARPDAYTPIGVMGDRLPGARALDVRFQVEYRTFRDILVGQDEVSEGSVLQQWEMAPVDRSARRMSLALTGGIIDGLAVGVRVPFVRNDARLTTGTLIGKVEAAGTGDVEAFALVSLHDSWPVRAHIGAGITFPNGSVDLSAATPDQPAVERVLPYDLQVGAGVRAFLPSAVVVVENRYGSTGIQAAARIHQGENDRGWAPGDVYSGNLFMQYRVNDWLGLSARFAVENARSITGFDPEHDEFASPLHWWEATGGTRIEIPLGATVRLAEGPLRGHRIQGEVIIPVHNDLNGPQLRSRWGASVSWGMSIGGRRDTGPELVTTPPGGTIAPPPDRPRLPTETDPPPRILDGSLATLCLASGATMQVFRTTAGETLIGEDRQTIDEAGGEEAVFGTGYAEGTTWYDDGHTIRFGGRDYAPSGELFAPNCDGIERVSDIDGVPLFAARGASRPWAELLVPVRPGEWRRFVAG